MMTAVVLAAGRGSRMGALTDATPKPLLDVAGRPLIAHVLSGLAAAGVRRAILVVGYRGAQIEAALGDGSGLGLQLEYCRQARTDGTARALLAAAPHLEGGPFVLSWTDILVAAPFYREFIEAYAARPCDAQLAVNATDDPWRGGAVYVAADGRVTRLVEKPARGTSTTPWNNAGIMGFSPLILDYARDVAPSPRGEYELPQAVANLVYDGHSAFAVPVRGPWFDVGTPDDLAAASACFAAAGGAQ
ncbi:MAG: nucleotidyltransferase family protein [bacterium]